MWLGVRESVRLVLLAILAAAVAMVSMRAGAQPVAEEADFTGLRVQIDNDLFAGRDLDRDYTGGFALTVSGRNASEGFASLDPLLSAIDNAVSPSEGSTAYHARQLGFMTFTPTNVLETGPIHNDRPYASLLFTSNGRVRVSSDNRSAWTSSLTIGVLGLSLSEQLHKAVHEVVGSEPPRGYDHQISAGGEPTARYMLAGHRLWIANPSRTVDVKTTVQGSVGYLTETSAAISMRIGRFSTPWWSFAPELTDYIAAPVPVEARANTSRPEFYFFAGARVKARAYNAFLQGQFRDSEVRYTSSELRPILAEAWAGFVTQLFEQTQVSYTLNYQTSEVRHGPAARDTLWGGVQLSHSF
jgi:hypothetical protein